MWSSVGCGVKGNVGVVGYEKVEYEYSVIFVYRFKIYRARLTEIQPLKSELWRSRVWGCGGTLG